MTTDRPVAIEVAFPVKQASLDSVHEKKVRHGRISTLHVCLARRPLVASRAAIIATLLPGPGKEIECQRLLRLLGGSVKTRNTLEEVGVRKVSRLKDEVEGGILDPFANLLARTKGGVVIDKSSVFEATEEVTSE